MTYCGVSEIVVSKSNPENLLRSVNLIKWKAFGFLKGLLLLELLYLEYRAFMYNFNEMPTFCNVDATQIYLFVLIKTYIWRIH